MPRALRIMKNRGNSRRTENLNRNECFPPQRPEPEIQPPPDHINIRYNSGVHSTSSSDSSDMDSDNDSEDSSSSDFSTSDSGSDSENSISDIVEENDPEFVENGASAINGSVSSKTKCLFV